VEERAHKDNGMERESCSVFSDPSGRCQITWPNRWKWKHQFTHLSQMHEGHVDQQAAKFKGIKDEIISQEF